MIGDRLEHTGGNLGTGGVVEEDEWSGRRQRRKPSPDVVNWEGLVCRDLRHGVRLRAFVAKCVSRLRKDCELQSVSHVPLEQLCDRVLEL